MVKKLQISLTAFLCAFSILYGSEEELKRRVGFGVSSSVISKYPISDFRRWARPGTTARIILDPGESTPSGYVTTAKYPEGHRVVKKELPISTREELYNQFISGYGPSDLETQKNLRIRRPFWAAHSDEEARKELEWNMNEDWETGRLTKLRSAEEAFLEKVERQTPESYVKPRKNRSLFSSYESPDVSSSSTPKTGYLTRFLTWIGWYKPTYISPQAPISESFKPLQQVSE